MEGERWGTVGERTVSGGCDPQVHLFDHLSSLVVHTQVRPFRPFQLESGIRCPPQRKRFLPRSNVKADGPAVQVYQLRGKARDSLCQPGWSQYVTTSGNWSFRKSVPMRF